MRFRTFGRSPRASIVLVALAPFAATVFSTRVASARRGESFHSQLGPDHHGDDEVEDPNATHPFHVTLDAVVGFGTSDVAKQVSQNIDGRPRPTAVLTSAHVFVESYVLDLSYDIGTRAFFGARLPFTYMSFAPDSVRLGAQTLGNLELGGAGRIVEGLVVGGGFFFPTASGASPSSPPPLDQNDVNAWLANHAGAAVRGRESRAPFEPGSWGLALRARYELELASHVFVHPFAQLEAMYAKSTDVDPRSIGAATLGVRGGVHLSSTIDTGLRAWCAIDAWGRRDTSTIAIEPELRAAFGRLAVALGVIVPLSGPLADPRWVGIHAVVGAAF